MTVHIGTSGWSYDHWTGVLYPEGLPARERLARYVQAFGTTELNASFYRWPRDASFANWRARTPEGFVLSVKAPRGLTHSKRLYAPERWAHRIAGAWHELGETRGVLLVQLGPGQERDDARLGYFLEQLPWWVRVAVELRHPSWHDEGWYRLLEHHGAAYCVMSGAQLPCVLRATAPFVYVRMHGPDDHTCTAAPTARTRCAGGPTASGSGRPRGGRCSCTSTTTATATRCATPAGCGRSSAAEV